MIPLQFLLAAAISWIVCYILTVTGQITDDPTHPQYMARADARINAIYTASWINPIYPGICNDKMFVFIFLGFVLYFVSLINMVHHS
jgi:hypothetical protein